MDATTILFTSVISILVVVIGILTLKYFTIRRKYKPVLDAETEAKSVRKKMEYEIITLEKKKTELTSEVESRRSKWEEEYSNLTGELEKLSENVDHVRELAEMQSFGIYEPVFNFEDSEKYKERIKAIRTLQKTLTKEKRAAKCDTEWTVSGNKAEGRKMTNRQLKLMLRAFNGECDTAVSKARFDNVTALEERIVKAFDAINELGKVNQCYITKEYLDSKIQELKASYEHALKKQEEKEEQSRIREIMREEEKAKKEIEKAEKEAEKEEQDFQKALIKARKELEEQTVKQDNDKIEALKKKISILESDLQSAGEKKSKAIARGRLTKSGHVYVISNIGSFGEDIYKIGMTRRLEPLDRVKELGDASVPFRFDVHAMMYTEDAPDLEKRIHERLSEHEVNLVRKREFFKTTLEEIEGVISSFDKSVEFVKTAVAEEYRESKQILEKQDLERQKKLKAIQDADVEHAKDKLSELKTKWKADDIA